MADHKKEDKAKEKSEPKQGADVVHEAPQASSAATLSSAISSSASEKTEAEERYQIATACQSLLQPYAELYALVFKQLKEWQQSASWRLQRSYINELLKKYAPDYIYTLATDSPGKFWDDLQALAKYKQQNGLIGLISEMQAFVADLHRFSNTPFIFSNDTVWHHLIEQIKSASIYVYVSGGDEKLAREGVRATLGSMVSILNSIESTLTGMSQSSLTQLAAYTNSLTQFMAPIIQAPEEAAERKAAATRINERLTTTVVKEEADEWGVEYTAPNLTSNANADTVNEGDKKKSLLHH